MLENFRTTNQESQLGTAAGTHEQRGGGGKAQRAGARDDERRDSSLERDGQASIKDDPHSKGHDCDHDHNRNEDR